MVRRYVPLQSRCRTAQYFGLSQLKLADTKDSFFQRISVASNLLKGLEAFLQQPRGMPSHDTVTCIKLNEDPSLSFAY